VTRRLSLAGQLLALQVVIVCAVLAGVAAVTVAQSTQRAEQTESARALAVAETLANARATRTALERDQLAYLRIAAENSRSYSGSEDVVVARTDRTVLASADPGLLGQPLDLGASRVLEGRSWVGDLDVPDGRAAMAMSPVYAPDGGGVLGLVAVQRPYPGTVEGLTAAVPNLLTYLGLASVIGIGGSLLLARRVKRQTLGLEPAEIVELVQQREAMLLGVKEGVVGMDNEHRITLINAAARQLLDIPADADVADLDERLRAVLTGAVAGEDQVVLRGERVLVLNRMAVAVRGAPVGAVVTLRDRTELESLVRELDSVRGLTDAMRAQAHEFSNRLHTLSGLLALGHNDEAQRFIAEVTDADTNLRRALSERIADPRIAALMLAKSVVAAERGVELQLVEDARLDHSLLDAREGLTLLGNLIDNALDAAASGERRPPLVCVFLADDAGALLVRVRDTGSGVPESERERVFEPGYSTKEGGGRGVGLSLVRELVERRGGWIEVDDAEDGRGGAVFTAWLPDAVSVETTVTS
jgi:two-component system, CitB family, sensor kinase